MQTLFNGSPVSAYGVKNGRVDYACFTRNLDMVRANDIMCATAGTCGEWELYHGSETDADGECREIFQVYIISETARDMFTRYTDDPIYYNDVLNLYAWGVTFMNCPWEAVLTDIELSANE